MVVRSIRSASPSAFWVIGPLSVTKVKIPACRAESPISPSIWFASACDTSAARYSRNGIRSLSARLNMLEPPEPWADHLAGGYGRAAPSSVCAYQDSDRLTFSTLEPGTGESMM
jgi:hypothetical protein